MAFVHLQAFVEDGQEFSSHRTVMAIAVKAIDECRLLSNIQSAFGNMPVSLDQTSIQMVPSHTLPIVFRGEGHKIPRGPIIPCVHVAARMSARSAMPRHAQAARRPIPSG
jgi:hypothetical protein